MVHTIGAIILITYAAVAIVDTFYIPLLVLAAEEASWALALVIATFWDTFDKFEAIEVV